jgi:hypothetical protein
VHCLPICLRNAHRKIDGGMVGHVEKKNLRRAEKKRGLHARCFRRQPALKQGADEMTQGAEPAQHGRGQRTR